MCSSIKDQTEYSDRERVEFGLMAVFPTIETYRSFIEEDKEDEGPFVRIARTYGIIGEDKYFETLKAFIKENSRSPDDCTPPAHLPVFRTSSFSASSLVVNADSFSVACW